MTVIGEKEIASMVYRALYEELEDMALTYTEAAKKVKEYIESENL